MEALLARVPVQGLVVGPLIDSHEGRDVPPPFFLASSTSLACFETRPETEIVSNQKERFARLYTRGQDQDLNTGITLQLDLAQYEGVIFYILNRY